MSAAAENVEVFCKNYGTTFSVFLQQMADHNQRVVCPKCGQTHTYSGSDARNPSASQPKT
jgi:ribosomal protein S27AE